MTPNLIQRLGLSRELDGHTGCVNCLEWSSDGRLGIFHSVGLFNINIGYFSVVFLRLEVTTFRLFCGIH